MYVSSDDGKSWKKIPTMIKPDSKGNAPSMHMNEHGITLRHGKHKGRLIRPSRWYAGQNHRSKWPEHYTNAIYSDDGGKTWQTSEPFPAKGTGEAMLAELSDGTSITTPAGTGPRKAPARAGAGPPPARTATIPGKTLPSAKCCPTVHRTPTTAAWPASRAWP